MVELLENILEFFKEKNLYIDYSNKNTCSYDRISINR